MKKIVNFTGAGLSSIAGCPTISNFYVKAEETIDMLENSLFQLADEKEDTYIEEKEDIEFRINICRSILNFKEKKCPYCNIEDLYRKLDMKNSLGLIFYEDIIKKVPLTLDKIVKFIAIVIEEQTLDSIKDYSQHYKPLYSADSVIITPSYDISFEMSNLTHSQLNYRPLSYLKQGRIDYGIENIGPYIEIINNDKSIIKDRYEIFKLHGSLNFGICKKCGKVYYLDEDRYHKMISKKGLTCHDCKETLDILIIPPTMSKLSMIEKDKWSNSYNPSSDILSKIWNKAYKHIMLCSEIRFIGYSFPETDMHMRDFVFEALSENEFLEHILIITDMKYGYEKINFEERYLKTIPTKFHRLIFFYYEGFEKFTKDIIKDNRLDWQYI